MAKTTVHTVAVHFGDCDPAGIVFFPNFSRWMDAASLAFFMECGVPPWRELVKTRGIVGTPLLEINTKFIKAVTYGETITITTWIEEWRDKVFVQMHRVTRGDDLICEGREVRAIPVPQDIKALCS
jgi:4-hydroxybenzoyl-CoA thioesterase